MKTIGIIALSGEADREKTENAKLYFEKQGFKVKLSSNIYKQNRYFAGTDKEKIEALHDFFKDSEIDVIICARGGYGTIRLINHIDYDLIKKHPKIFCGYSDVSALLLMIYKRTGMITYHGPMACTDFAGNVNSFTEAGFYKALNNEFPNFQGCRIYKQGTAKGILWGGNLSTVVSLCGTDFIPDKDFIFFAEDLNEPVYKIDKMFTQLFNMENFRERCKGIILGDFLDNGNSEWLDELFSEFSVPAASGFKITHAAEKITIPIGKQCIISYDGIPIVNIK